MNVFPPLHVQMDDARGVITIEGIQYSYELFTELSFAGMAEGQLFKIVKRDDRGMLTIQRIES